MSSIGARLFLPISVLAGGCAGMTSNDCQDANWYDVGYRDASFRLQSQAAVYAQQCERRHGRWEFPDRMT